jgi:hypothetical protein
MATPRQGGRQRYPRTADWRGEQFPHLRNGRPWRQKDIDDIKTLRRLAAEADA